MKKNNPNPTGGLPTPLPTGVQIRPTKLDPTKNKVKTDDEQLAMKLVQELPSFIERKDHPVSIAAANKKLQ